MNLNYTKVQHFLTIVKYMSLSRAAKELYISQPALSLSLSRLEEELGVVLLYRSGNKLILSQEGEALLPQFERIRQDCEALMSEAKSFRRLNDKYISIVFSGSVLFFSTLYMTDFLNSFDGMPVKKSFVDIAQATSMLLTNQADFAITFPPISNPQITTVEIMEEAIGVAVRKGHPLAAHDMVDIEDLRTLKLHGLTKQNYFRQTCDELLLDHGLSPVYITEEEYPSYFRRLHGELDDAAFFTTVSHYKENFPQDRFILLHFRSGEIRRKMGISYLESGRKQYRYNGLLERIQSDIQKQSNYHLAYMKALQKSSEALDI